MLWKGKRGRKGLFLYKGSAGICSKPRQRGNNRDWVQQLINHFNFQVPGGHNRFCLCFCCCDVFVRKRNHLPPSSSSVKFCNLPTEPLSFLKKYKTLRSSVQFWVVETSSWKFPGSHPNPTRKYQLVLSFSHCYHLSMLSPWIFWWFSYLVLKILRL